MDERKASLIITDFYEKEASGTYSEEDEFLYVEALKYLSNHNNGKAIQELGGYFYEHKDFQKAEKYYKLATKICPHDAFPFQGLGYIYYYGRLGTPDFKKAFECYSKSVKIARKYDKGDNCVNLFESSYKLADMYLNGYYVEKSYDKYVEIIMDLYRNYPYPQVYEYFKPQLFCRVAKIYENSGDKEEAIGLLKEAKEKMIEVLNYNPFFGNFSIMNRIINELYKLTKLNVKNADFFDLYEILKKECKIKIRIKNENYTLFCKKEENMSVLFNNKWYNGIDKFIMNASVNGAKLYKLCLSIKILEVIYE